MQIESFVCVCVCVCVCARAVFDMVQQTRKWKISVEMRHRGRLASALSTVITKTPSERLVFSTQCSGTGLKEMKLTALFSLHPQWTFKRALRNHLFLLTVKFSVNLNLQNRWFYRKCPLNLENSQFSVSELKGKASWKGLNARLFH